MQLLEGLQTFYMEVRRLQHTWKWVYTRWVYMWSIAAERYQLFDNVLCFHVSFSRILKSLMLLTFNSGRNIISYCLWWGSNWGPIFTFGTSKSTCYGGRYIAFSQGEPREEHVNCKFKWETWYGPGIIVPQE